MIKLKRIAGIKCVTSKIIEDELIAAEDKNIVFVVPEFSKAQVERLVLGNLSSDQTGSVSVDTGADVKTVSASFTDGDIMSFRKLAANLLEACGRTYYGADAEITLRNAVYSILTTRGGDFKKFHNLANHYEYINNLVRLLGDFSRYGVGPEQLAEALSGYGGMSEDYRAKLEDLKLLMEELEGLNVKYGLSLLKDPIAMAAEVADNLAANPARLKERRFRTLKKLVESEFVVIGFGTTRLLTPHEYCLINALSDLGASIVFYVLGGDTDSEEKVYRVSDEFTSRMKELPSVSVECLEIEDSKSRLENLTQSFAFGAEPDTAGADDCVQLCELVTADDRIGYVMNEIIRLTREEGYRYRDIRIVCCDDELLPLMRANAEIFGLDIFIDRKISLGSTVVPMFAQIILLLPEVGYTAELFIKAMRTGMLRVPPYIADCFDNYCRYKNIVGGARLFDERLYELEVSSEEKDERKKAWIYGDIVLDGKTVKEGPAPIGEILWKTVVRDKLIPLRKFAEAIKNEHTLSGKARKMMEFFDSQKEFIEALRDEYQSNNQSDSAVALVRGYSELMQLLTSFTHPMNDVEISQRSMLSLIRMDMRNKTEGTIPLRVDSVEITNPARSFVAPCKVMFVIGATRKNFPYKKSPEGILSGNELQTLSDSLPDVFLPDKAEAQSREEFVTCCLMLGSVSDKLYMVHEFGQMKSRVYEFFESCVSPESVIVNRFKNPVMGEAVKARHGIDDNIPTEIMTALIAPVKSVSVSSIEMFRTCPLRFVLTKVLSVNQREDHTVVKSNDFGTLAHKMFELAMQDIRDNCKTVDELRDYYEEVCSSPDKLKTLTGDYCAKAIKAEKIPGSLDENGEVASLFDKTTGIKLRRVFGHLYTGVVKDCIDTGFLPAGFELELGKGDFKYSVDCGDVEFRFTGYVDRYDSRTGEDGKQEIRIEDYKTFDKDIHADELIDGTQIQLPMYASILRDGLDARVVNYGYLPVIIKAQKDKETDLTPKNLFDTDELEADNGKGKLARFTRDNIDTFLNYSKWIVEDSCRQIAAGKSEAVVSPRGNCDYCPARGLCGNNAADPKRAPAPAIPKPDAPAPKGEAGLQKQTLKVQYMQDVMAGKEDKGSAEDGEDK